MDQQTKPLGITEVVLRDASQSLLATRVRLDDMLPIAAKLDRDRAPFILYVGNGAHVLDFMIETAPEVISLDWRVELADAARRIGGRACRHPEIPRHV